MSAFNGQHKEYIYIYIYLYSGLSAVRGVYQRVTTLSNQ